MCAGAPEWRAAGPEWRAVGPEWRAAGPWEWYTTVLQPWRFQHRAGRELGWELRQNTRSQYGV
eukprot:8569976-Pyramimonas_sp.AAC.1